TGMFGLVGPNGPGKSTLMKILPTLLEPDQRTAQLDGLKSVEQKDETRKTLWDSRKKALGGYSGVVKQRFGIAQALLANPKLIIVDEPTAGLDPAERNRFLNLLSSIGRNVVVILSTHIVEDVRELCSRMAIISQGQLLLEGKPAETLEALKGRIWKKIVATDAEREAMEKSMKVISTHLVGGLHEVRVHAEASPGEGFVGTEADLEDVYFLNLRSAEKN